MIRVCLLFVFLIQTTHYFCQKNKQISIDFDDLISEINQISISNKQYVKYDSLLIVLNSLKQKIDTKDSVITTLKNKVNVIQIKSDQLKETEYYIIIGAFKIFENANQLVKTKSIYPLKIYNFPTTKLNYVGYKVKISDPFLLILNYFRQKVVKDAWVLKVTN